MVFLVGFFGAQKPKPISFYPALFLGAGGAGIAFFGLVQVFNTLHLL
ncbi:hypothetical protein [Streptomyces anulatus]